MVLLSEEASESRSAGKMLGVSSVNPEGVPGESRTGVNGVTGVVTVSIRSVKPHKIGLEPKMSTVGSVHCGSFFFKQETVYETTYI